MPKLTIAEVRAQVQTDLPNAALKNIYDAELRRIVKVVGNRTYEYVKELEERRLVHGERKSRTKTLSTTPHFEEYFGTKKEEIKKVFKQMEK